MGRASRMVFSVNATHAVDGDLLNEELLGDSALGGLL
jgi:hypothetical protein